MAMNHCIDALEPGGSHGFIPVSQLRECKCQCVSEASGIYLTVLPESMKVSFLECSPAGHFKGRDPTVGEDCLRGRWVPDAPVLYVGSSAHLRKRLNRFLDFGYGCAVGHWGGRLVWQIANAQDLLIVWHPCHAHTEVEAEALSRFRRAHGRLPFANLRR